MSPSIMLYGGGQGFGLPEVSPYVLKTEVQLRMAGLAYRKARANLETAPKHKMPYIDDDGEIVSDSTFIRAHIERKYRVDLDAGLTARQRAKAWAIERMVEDHLSWAAIHGRWLDPVNFAKGPAHFFDDAPEAIRDRLRQEVLERVRATHYAQGMGRHSFREITQLGSRSLGALSALLGDRAFLFAAKPTGSDAIVFAMLACVLTPFFETDLRCEAEALPNLAAYTARMMRAFFPDFAWAAPSRAAA